MWTETTDYSSILQDFRRRFNTEPRIRKLVQNWNRDVLLESMDTGKKYALIVRDTELTEVRSVDQIDQDGDGLVLLQAEEAILGRVFSGRYNPATALNEGNLAVFSPDRDKVKLEAIAMVLWRLDQSAKD